VFPLPIKLENLARMKSETLFTVVEELNFLIHYRIVSFDCWSMHWPLADHCYPMNPFLKGMMSPLYILLP